MPTEFRKRDTGEAALLIFFQKNHPIEPFLAIKRIIAP